MWITASHKHASKGFSLIEVLVAMLVLGIGMVSIAKFQGTLFKDSVSAKEREQASQLAQAKLAELSDFSNDEEFQQILVGNIDAAATDSDNIAGVSTTFVRSWSIAPENGGKSARVQVRVRWQDSKGEDQDVYVSSVISNDIPIALSFTSLTPPPDKDTDPPPDTVEIISVPSAPCQCGQDVQLISAYQADNPFRRVGGMMGGGGMETGISITIDLDPTPPADGSAECTECCGEAVNEAPMNSWSMAAASPAGEQMWAADGGFSHVANYTDGGLPSGGRHFPNKLYRTGMMSGGMSGGLGVITTTTYYAYCTYVTLTKTTASGSSSSTRVHHMHKKYKTEESVIAVN